MPNITVYVSRDLFDQVKDAQLPVSEIFQQAVVAELDRISHRHISQPIPGQLGIDNPRRQ